MIEFFKKTAVGQEEESTFEGSKAVEELLAETLGDTATIQKSKEVAELMQTDGKIESLEPSKLMKFLNLVDKIKGIAIGLGITSVGGVLLTEVIKTTNGDISSGGVKMAGAFVIGFLGLITATMSAEKTFSGEKKFI